MTETTHFDRAFLVEAMQQYHQERAPDMGGV